MLFTVSSTGGFYRKAYFTLVLKTPYKKIREARKLKTIHG
jgi:hypothetical protein